MEKKTIKRISLAAALATAAFSIGVAGTYAYTARHTAGTVHVSVGNIKFDFDKYDGEEMVPVGAEAMHVDNAAPGDDYTAYFSLKNVGTVPFTTVVTVIEYDLTDVDHKPATDEQAKEIKDNVGIIFHDDNTHDYSLYNVDYDNLRFDLINNGTNIIQPGEEFEFSLNVNLGRDLTNTVMNINIDFPVRLECTQYIPEK